MVLPGGHLQFLVHVASPALETLKTQPSDQLPFLPGVMATCVHLASMVARGLDIRSDNDMRVGGEKWAGLQSGEVWPTDCLYHCPSPPWTPVAGHTARSSPLSSRPGIGDVCRPSAQTTPPHRPSSSLCSDQVSSPRGHKVGTTESQPTACHHTTSSHPVPHGR